MKADTDPATTGSSPEVYQITVTLPGYAATAAFRDWLTSGACATAFWHWMSANGRYV